MADEKHLVGYCALCCKRAQFIRVDPFRLARQRGPTGSARVEGVARAKGKDSCRSTKQLILSPGGIFYGRYNLQDASLKATRVYQRKPAPSPPPPLQPHSPFRDPSFVSRRIFLFRLHLTVGLFLFNSSRALRRYNFFRGNFYLNFYSPLPRHFRIYLSKISHVLSRVPRVPQERTTSVVVKYCCEFDV